MIFLHCYLHLNLWMHLWIYDYLWQPFSYLFSNLSVQLKNIIIRLLNISDARFTIDPSTLDLSIPWHKHYHTSLNCKAFRPVIMKQAPKASISFHDGWRNGCTMYMSVLAILQGRMVDGMVMVCYYYWHSFITDT